MPSSTYATYNSLGLEKRMTEKMLDRVSGIIAGIVTTIIIVAIIAIGGITVIYVIKFLLWFWGFFI
jgi:hypothetical protein